MGFLSTFFKTLQMWLWKNQFVRRAQTGLVQKPVLRLVLVWSTGSEGQRCVFYLCVSDWAAWCWGEGVGAQDGDKVLLLVQTHLFEPLIRSGRVKERKGLTVTNRTWLHLRTPMQLQALPMRPSMQTVSAATHPPIHPLICPPIQPHTQSNPCPLHHWHSKRPPHACCQVAMPTHAASKWHTWRLTHR